MPAGTGDHLYKRGGTWYARIQINGQDIRRSLRTGSRSEAAKRLKVILEQADHIRFYGSERHQWQDAVIGWAAEAHRTIRPSTLRRYQASLRQMRGVLDDLFVDEISSRTIAQIARRPGITNATRRRDISAASAVLSWCVAQDWRQDNPARNWDRSRIRERREPIILPEADDIDRVVAAAPGQIGNMIRLAQYTGMRQEEIASLRRDQIRGGSVQLIRTKTGRARAVPLDDRALSTIAGAPIYLGSPYVFWHDAGLRYSNVRVGFGTARRRAGVRQFRFHDLRHWFAVDYLRRGGSIYTLQQILGHSSIVMTERYLDHLTPDEQVIVRAGTGPAQR